MAHEYTQNRFNYIPVDLSRCKASVSSGAWHSKQCRRKVWKDGWCKQHHPDTEKARQKERDKRWAIEKLRRQVVEEAVKSVKAGEITPELRAKAVLLMEAEGHFA